MFLTTISPVTYSDPWESPFHQRQAQFFKGDFRVAYFYERPDAVTFRYRVYNMIQALHHIDKNISGAYFCMDEIDLLPRVIDMADVFVICRARFTDKLSRLILRAKNKGTPVFYDIDDIVYDTALAPLLMDALDLDLNHPPTLDFWFSYISRLGRTLDLCDQVITTNDFLGSRIEKHFGKKVSVIPNFLNREQVELSEKIYDEKKTLRFQRSEQIHLGYFSGTPSHNKDFAVLDDALLEIMKENTDVELWIVGFLDLKGPMRRLASRIKFFPLQDFLNLQRFIGQVEINLIPLQDNEFTNCKSELKFFEAGIAGTLSIASPTYIFHKNIKHGENGYLARSYEWYETIQKVLNNFEDYPTVAEKTYQYCYENYAWVYQGKRIEEILTQNS